MLASVGTKHHITLVKSISPNMDLYISSLTRQGSICVQFHLDDFIVQLNRKDDNTERMISLTLPVTENIVYALVLSERREALTTEFVVASLGLISGDVFVGSVKQFLFHDHDALSNLKSKLKCNV